MERTEEIMALAATLGKTQESEGLRTLCQAAEAELTGLLRDGVTVQECGQAFILAAAWLALAGLEGSDSGVERFTAGAVTIQRSDGSLRQKALRLQAFQVMRPWLRDRGFVFRGVKG